MEVHARRIAETLAREGLASQMDSAKSGTKGNVFSFAFPIQEDSAWSHVWQLSRTCRELAKYDHHSGGSYSRLNRSLGRD